VNRNRIFAIAITVMWIITFGIAMDNWTIGICIGITFGMSFGLLDSSKEEENGNE
jgi:hypothetical protein